MSGLIGMLGGIVLGLLILLVLGLARAAGRERPKPPRSER